MEVEICLSEPNQMAAAQALTLAHPRPKSRLRKPAQPPWLELVTPAPVRRHELVPRPALVQHLRAAREAALALIIAPAGYGKTTLLAEWAAQEERPFVWLAPGLTGTQDNSVAMRLPMPGEAHDLDQLIRATASRHPQFVVVIDDAHLMPPSVLGSSLGHAVRVLPPGCTIAVASRSDPELATARMRANGLLCEVRTQQLRMSRSESSALLGRLGVDCEPGETGAVIECAEGWPAALCLAALAARENPAAVAHFGGTHHMVAEYLRDEVLDALPRDLVRFSTRTAVLDELSGPVCDAVLQTERSSHVLERLARLNPLLVPLDSSHHRYRWHGLMRDVLRGRLAQRETELEPALRLRASAWYADQEDLDAAIAQAAAAGDAALTARLLWPNLITYLTHGKNQLVQDWLSLFSAERIAGDPMLAATAALSAVTAGEVGEGERWSLKAAAALDQTSPVRTQDRTSSPFATAFALTNAIGARNGLPSMRDIGLRTARAERDDSPWRPICLLVGAVAMHLLGDGDDAELTLEEAGRLSGNRLPTIAVLCLAQRAMIAIERTDFELAAELSDRAVLLAAEWDLADEPLLAIAFAAAAASRAHQGRADEAKHDLRLGIDLLASLGDFAPWYEAETRILLAHASLWLADVVGARTLLAEASRFARRVGDAVVFSAWFESAWARMDTLAETSLAGPSSLTIAELRVLRFLPSHRSFREIAAQLGVSANTVKTQAHAVYRKLGAASRSEAISRANEAGLLGQ